MSDGQTASVKVVNEAPGWFVVAILRLICDNPHAAVSSPAGELSAKAWFTEWCKTAGNLSALATQMRRKRVEAGVFKGRWQQLYPHASSDAAELMQMLLSDIPITRGVAACDVKPHRYMSGDTEMLLIQFWQRTDGETVKPCLAFSCEVAAHARRDDTAAVFLVNTARKAEGMEAMASLNTFGYMLQWTNRIEEDAFEREVVRSTLLLDRY